MWKYVDYFAYLLLQFKDYYGSSGYLLEETNLKAFYLWHTSYTPPIGKQKWKLNTNTRPTEIVCADNGMIVLK